jgi:phosphoglycolate phosphatase-like HAD superfamily hydrolase
MRFDYLLWDFDGTLFDTYPPLIDSIARALADSGISEPRDSIDGLLSQTLALTLTTLADTHDLDRAELERQTYHYWRQVPIEAYAPFPGVIDLCRRFIRAGGQHYIFTHRGLDTLMQMLNHQGVAELFARIMTRDDGYPRKPDPAGFNALIARYELPRDRVLTIGDRDL